MKYKITCENIESALWHYCKYPDGGCLQCGLQSAGGNPMACMTFAQEHETEAAKAMGLEPVNEKDEKRKKHIGNVQTAPKMKEWFCTGSDCFQHCKKWGTFMYEYIEIREIHDDRYAVYNKFINLNLYTVEEMEEYCEPYYDSLESMVESYGFEGALQIIAECIFEQSGGACLDDGETLGQAKAALFLFMENERDFS